MQKLKKRHYFMVLIVIISLILAITNFSIIKKNRVYYTGKIESINQNNGITTVKVSPVTSNRYFIAEIKANHQIEYDNINIAGLVDPRSKNFRRVKMGELAEMVKNLKVGDAIIFRVEDYDKNKYNFKINELAVDLTLK